MNYKEFKSAVIQNLPPGTLLDNPGGGTSIIKTYKDDTVRYQRGKSTFSASLKLFHEVVVAFDGQTLSSTALKQYSHKFDSTRSGHSCNCTLLFLILQKIGLVDKILGSGKKGDPFYVKL